MDVTNGNIHAAAGADPVDRAWAILCGLQTISTPLLLSRERAGTLYHPKYAPDAQIYTLVLKVCMRTESKKVWDVILKVFELAKKEGILMKGSICVGLLRSISNSSEPALRRAELTKDVYLAALANDVPMKPTVMKYMQTQMRYFRYRHSKMFEAHLAELIIDMDGQGDSEDFTTDVDENDDEDETA